MTTARNHWRVCHEISRIFISKINSDLRFGLTKKYEIYAELQNCRLHIFVAHETIKIWCRLGAFRWRLPTEPDRKWDKYRCNRNTRCHSEFFRSFLSPKSGRHRSTSKSIGSADFPWNIITSLGRASIENNCFYYFGALESKAIEMNDDSVDFGGS